MMMIDCWFFEEMVLVVVVTIVFVVDDDGGEKVPAKIRHDYFWMQVVVWIAREEERLLVSGTSGW